MCMKEFESSRTAELLRLMSERAADLSILILDTAGTITSWGGVAADIEGYAPEALLGKHVSIFFTPEDREAGLPARLLRRAADDGHVEVEGWRLRSDGSRYWADVLTSATRDLDGRLIGFVRIVRDITSRQAALDLLRESEQRYRHLVENATDIIYTHDLDGRVLSVNAAAEKLLGFERDQVIGRSIFDIVAPDFHSTVRDMIARRVQGNASTTYALDVTARDGRPVSLEVSAQLIFEHGEPVGVQGIARDITERKRAAEMVERSERYFRTLIESASEAITIINADGTIRYSSPALERLLGYTPEERRGRSILDLIHVNDANRARAMLERLGQEPDITLQAQLRLRHSDKSWRRIDLTARNLLTDPNVGGLVVNWRDVTPQVEAEERLIEREELFRSIVENSSEGIFIIDAKGFITFLNDRYAAMLGYEPSELLGRSALDAVPEDGHAALLEGGARRRSTGQPEQFDLTMRRKDGTPISVIVSIGPLFDRNHKYIGSVGLFTEITERKQLEVQLRTSQKIEAVGQLAGGVAHDFNNLLTAIRGHVDLLLNEVPSDSPYRADIEEIRKGADRAASLTQQLLAFSRRQILQPRVLGIDQAVTGVDTLLRRLIGEDITLVTTLETGGACVSADLGRLEQILMNLAVNARDAMPSGGQLNISTRVVDVAEDFTRANPGSRTGRFVQITVTDSGQGMSEDTLSHLFEPFFTTKALGRGTGLGLATVYGIVKQSNGYIRVQSKLGAGTRFDILLPVVEAEPTPAHEVQLPAAASAQDATVLVAEDEDAVRSLACRVLRKHGFNVLEASNGAHAIDVARNHDGVIHLLLSDLVMPQLGGRELAEQLMAARPNIKVVFMSGYSSDTLMQRGINHAQVGFLEKPFTPNALVSKIRELLSST